MKTKAKIFHYHDPELLFVGFVLRWFFKKNVIFDVHENIASHLDMKPYFPFGIGKVVSIIYSILEKVLLTGQEIIVANINVLDNYPRRAFLVQNYPVLSDTYIKQSYEKEIPDLVYLGAVEAGRGALTYLELAKKLKASGRRFKLTMIGQYNFELGEQMSEYISNNDLIDCVEMTGRMEWSEAMKIVSNASIGLCILKQEPNYTSCLATKILEYMMAGVPVLASDFDTWRPFVSETGSGRMVAPDNMEQIYSSCCEMLEDKQSLKQMALAGRKAVEEKYNWDSEFANMFKCYKKCLN